LSVRSEPVAEYPVTSGELAKVMLSTPFSRCLGQLAGALSGRQMIR
jgi:hypothetical protein